MKVKEYFLSVVLNAFLAYLWILFINHVTKLVNSMNNTFIVGIFIMGIGTVLFLEISNRATSINDYKLTHPIKITGALSFALVIVAYFIGLN